MTKVETLQREYDALQRDCGGFDRETTLLQRQRNEQQRQWQMERKQMRAALVHRKGEVHEMLKAAKAEEEAEKTAAKALGLQESAPPAKAPKAAAAPVVTLTESIDLPRGTEVTALEAAPEKSEKSPVDELDDKIVEEDRIQKTEYRRGRKQKG